MKPIISIITPVYNTQDFIKEGCDSIKNQSLDSKYFEWIILDDCSKDSSFKNILENTKEMNNVYAFSRNKNLGTSITRNQASNLASGKYLTFFDMDDLLVENALEKTIEFMESNPKIKFSYSKHKRIDKNGSYICNRESLPFKREDLLHKNFVGHLKTIDKSVHDKIGGFDIDFGKYAEDYDYILRVSEILNNEEIARNPEFLYEYRIHGNNNMSNIEMMRKHSCKAIENSLKRKEKINVNAFWSHKEGLYNYYNWVKK